MNRLATDTEMSCGFFAFMARLPASGAQTACRATPDLGTRTGRTGSRRVRAGWNPVRSGCGQRLRQADEGLRRQLFGALARVDACRRHGIGTRQAVKGVRQGLAA